MGNKRMGLGTALIVIAIWLAVVIGYFLNIADLVGGNAGEGAIFIVRIAGLFLGPVGSFMGWFF